MTKQRIAVVSTDGVNVDDHFGKAVKFMVYDIDGSLSLIEERSTEMLSVGDPNHPFDADKFKRVTDVIKDCNQVYATRIGDGPAAKLKDMGIEAVVYNGPIDKIPR